MPVVFRCHHCGAVFAAPDALAGKAARCQGCRGVVDVPFASVPLAAIAHQQPALVPLGAAAMPAHAFGAAQPSLQPMRPDDPLMELLGPRPQSRRSGLSAQSIVGGGVGLACAIITIALVTWTLNRVWRHSPDRTIAVAPHADGFIIQPRPIPSSGRSPAQEGWRNEFNRAPREPFVQTVPPSPVPPPSTQSGSSYPGRNSSNSPGSTSSPSSARSSGSTSFAPSSPIPGPDSSIRPAAAETWKLEPDPSTSTLELKDGDFKVPLSGPQPQIVFPESQSRFVLAWSGDNSRPECTMYDLKTGLAIGKKISLFGLQPSSALVSPDGRYVAMPRVDEGSEQNRVRVAAVSFASGESQPRIEFKCSEFHKALFGAAHQVLTAHAVGQRYSSNQKHYLTLWDVQTGKSIREVDLDALDASQGAQLKFLTVSPGGRYAAYPREDEIVFIDLNEGQVAGRAPLSDESRGQARLSFSPDGKLLASIEGSSFRADLRVLDMSTGKVVVDERIETSSFGLNWHDEDLSWLPGNAGLFVGGQVMLELTSAREAWRFPRSRGEPRRILRDGEMVTLGADRNKFYLYSAPLPQKQIAQVFDAMRVRGGAAEDVALPPFTPTNLAAAPRIDPPTSAIAWAYTPDPVGLAGRADQREFLVTDEFSHLLTARFASAAPRVAVQRLPSSGQSVIDVFDAAGKKLHSVDVPREYRLLDVSPSGTRGLIGVERDQKWDRLDCISLEKKQHIAGWRPYGEEDDRGQDRADRVVWAAFADEDHVVTNNSQGKLACWTLPGCQAVYAFQRFGKVLALSGGRKYVLGAEGNNLRVFESLSGRCMGQLPVTHSTVDASGGAFRPDGEEVAVNLAVGNDHFLARWNAKTGQLVDEAPTRRADRVEYLSGNYLLLGGQRLFDVRNRRNVWRYLLAPGGQRVEGNTDSRTWYTVGRTENDGSRYLVAFDTPSDDVQRKTADLTFDTQFLLKPGDSVRVSVDLSGVGLTDLQGELEQQLEKAVDAKGFRPSDTASVSLSLVAIERSSGRQMVANLPNGVVNLPGAVRVDEKDVVYHLTLSDAAGKVMWGAAHRIGMTPITMIKVDDPAMAVRQRMLDEFRVALRRSEDFVARGMPSYVFMPSSGAEVSILAYHEERPPLQAMPDKPDVDSEITTVRPPDSFPLQLSVGREDRRN